MEHTILTQTTFFRILDNDGQEGIGEAYRELTLLVARLCRPDRQDADAFTAMTYAETELRHHCRYRDSGTAGAYVRKAADFIREMRKGMRTELPSGRGNARTAGAFRWTGNTIDLVELVYGLHEMACIDDGDVGIKRLAAFFYELFGIKGKDAYRFYADIKLRKDISRTYFLDRMAKRLNGRMDRDEQLQAKRR